jgi:hypothetical protein
MEFERSVDKPRDSLEEALRRLMGGARISQAIYVAAKLGIPDLLAGGPSSTDELARATDAPSLYRVLRLLTAIDVLSEKEPSVFALAPLGEYFRTGARGDLRTLAIFEGEIIYGPFGAMYYTVKTGESAFEHLQGESMFQHLMADPERARLFQEAMTAGAAGIAASVVEAYDFSRFQTIVDVGGDHGTLLAIILRAHPSLRGVLFDLSYVVAGAREPLDRAGVLDRCEIQNGDF